MGNEMKYSEIIFTLLSRDVAPKWCLRLTEECAKYFESYGYGKCISREFFAEQNRKD